MNKGDLLIPPLSSEGWAWRQLQGKTSARAERTCYTGLEKGTFKLIMNKFAPEIANKPIFTISVDLELAWGFILHPKDKVLGILESDPQYGRGAVNWLLKLLEGFGIPATWAVVGHLFLDEGEGEEFICKEMPQFEAGWLNWDFYSTLRSNPLYSGRDLVEAILANPVKHEIGLHGFFHIPFSRCSREVAIAEIKAGITAASKFGISPKSFVFPYNYIGHLDVLKSHGIQIYRKNLRWLSEEQKALIPEFGALTSELGVLLRRLDLIIHELVATPASLSNKGGIWEFPSSLCLYDPRVPFPVLPRAKIGLNRAIHSKKFFHIWLHYWDLLLNERLAKDLERFLALVTQKRDEGKLEVMTMGQAANSR